MNRRLIAVAFAATAMFGLTACTGGGAEPADDTPSSSGSASGGTASASQTVEEACDSVNDTIQNVSDDFAGVTAENPADAAAAFQAAADAIGEASTQVGNAEVAALLPDIQAVFETAGEAMTALAQGDASKVAELQNLGTELRDSFTTFQELCLQ